MIERYSRKVMRGVWTEQNKFQAYLEVEILSCEAWSQLGVIPKEDVDKIRAAATFDVDRIKEIEEITRHDVVAFTRAVSESLGPERKWVHYGLTSTDVVDTANGYLLKQEKCQNLSGKSLRGSYDSTHNESNTQISKCKYSKKHLLNRPVREHRPLPCRWGRSCP